MPRKPVKFETNNEKRNKIFITLKKRKRQE